MVNGTFVFFGIMILFFLIMDGFLVWGIFNEKGKLDICVTDQSIFCPTIICNDPSVVPVDAPLSEAGKSCNGYSYRYLDADKTKYECNYPGF